MMTWVSNSHSRKAHTLKIWERGVVEKLEETPSSQKRAFWRETPGAEETMSVPTDTDAKALRAIAAAAALLFLIAVAIAIS